MFIIFQALNFEKISQRGFLGYKTFRNFSEITGFSRNFLKFLGISEFLKNIKNFRSFQEEFEEFS
jgi:hypothetical protein